MPCNQAPPRAPGSRRLAQLSAHVTTAAAAATTSIPPISLSIPPAGQPLEAAAATELRGRVDALRARLAPFAEGECFPDAAICTKAVEFALKYCEFYDQRPAVEGWLASGIEGPSGKALTPERRVELEAMLQEMPPPTVAADRVLRLGEARAAALEAGTASLIAPLNLPQYDDRLAVNTAPSPSPTRHATDVLALPSKLLSTTADPTTLADVLPATAKVCGYTSPIDGCVQPYGLELPLSPITGGAGPGMPLYVWLHGRGAAATDVHFMYGCMRAAGQMRPEEPDAMVLHPFGRQCLGFKVTAAP